MKKTLIIVLALTLLMNMSTIAFASENGALVNQVEKNFFPEYQEDIQLKGAKLIEEKQTNNSIMKKYVLPNGTIIEDTLTVSNQSKFVALSEKSDNGTNTWSKTRRLKNNQGVIQVDVKLYGAFSWRKNGWKREVKCDSVSATKKIWNPDVTCVSFETSSTTGWIALGKAKAKVSYHFSNGPLYETGTLTICCNDEGEAS